MRTVGIIVTTYNDTKHFNLLIESINKQSYQDIHLIVSDDGSEKEYISSMKDILKSSTISYDLLELEHGERGIARVTAIDKAIDLGVEYILIIDSDMILEEDTLKHAVQSIENSSAGALIIKEIPYSESKNFFTKVKIFERMILNNGGEYIDKNSIEAARFWITKEYIKSGGINSKQIAFEEIQPTLRYLEKGGVISRLYNKGIYHDEKKVTFSELINKKRYYFSKMDVTFTTEKQGFLKALKRYYFFRPVLYRLNNIAQYLRHPILFIGMLYMYMALTAVAVIEMVKPHIAKIKGEEIIN